MLHFYPKIHDTVRIDPFFLNFVPTELFSFVPFLITHREVTEDQGLDNRGFETIVGEDGEPMTEL